MIDERSDLAAVAFAVCTALEQAGVTAVLTGGSAATFYAPEAYQSDDLDFVITFKGEGSQGARALATLGYRESGAVYVHSRSRFPVEFPPGPLMIGGDLITGWETHHGPDDAALHVLSPTDSCRDRLAALLFWKDFSGLEQALAVFRAQAAQIELGRIRDWCARERQPEAFELFETRLRLLGLSR